MRELFLLIMSFFGLVAFSYGQKIGRSVVSSSGDYFKVNGAQLSWTLGEVMDENYSNRTASLSQGFEQGGNCDDPSSKTLNGNDGVNNEVADVVADIFEVKIYPNPAFDYINVSLGSAWEQDTFIEMIDLFGQSILKESINENEAKKLDVASLPSGIYILQVINNNLNTIKSFKINKIN